MDGTAETLHDVLTRVLVRNSGRSERTLARDVQEKLYYTGAATRHRVQIHLEGNKEKTL